MENVDATCGELTDRGVELLNGPINRKWVSAQRASVTRAVISGRLQSLLDSTVSDAGDFVDAALQLESSWQRAVDHETRIGIDLQFYGASVGAVRRTIRDLGQRYPGFGHDEITALASEL